MKDILCLLARWIIENYCQKVLVTEDGKAILTEDGKMILV